MTDGSKKGDEGSSSSPDHEADSPVVHDDLPEILEIFGSAPLVQDSEQPADSEFNGASWKTTDPQQQQEEADELAQPPCDWDPMASPGDENDALDLEEENEPEERTPVGLSTSHADPGDDSRPSSSAPIDRHLAEMRGLLQLNEDRLGRLELTLQDLSKQTNFLPPKLRGLGKKVDELSTSVSDARMRSLLSEIAGLGDLVEGALRAFSADDNEKGPSAEAHRYFKAIGTRVEQILDSYDIQVIPADTEFDPTVHNAVDIQVVEEERLDGHIIDVVRRGYRSEHSVLRFSEVIVGRFDGQKDTHEEEVQADDAGEQPDDISSTYAPFLGASGTAEDNEELTKRSDRNNTSDRPETKNDTDNSEDGELPPSV